MAAKLPRCLVNGKHTPGSQWEVECPVLRRARRHQDGPEDGPATTLQTPSKAPSESCSDSRGSDTGFGALSAARARLSGRPGRPRVGDDAASPRTRSRRRRERLA